MASIWIHEEADMKRVIIFLAVLALTLPWAGTASATTLSDNEFEYLVAEGGEAILTRYVGNAVELTIPDKLGGRPVKRIEEYAFANNGKLKVVTLPEGLETIGLRAFVLCIKLKSVRIPASVTDIGNSAFLYTNLSEISVDSANSVYKTVDGVLFHLPSDTLHTYPAAKKEVEYSVPSSTLSIESGAFSYCKDLKKVILPDSLNKIGESAFNGCSALTSLDIPAGVLFIGTGAFQATGLSAFKVAEKNPAYEQRDGVLFDLANRTLHTFPTNKFAREYRIPGDIQGIMPYAFADCVGLERLIYPEGMKNTFYAAFYNTLGLRDVVLPESIETIDLYSFYDCKNLKSVNIPSRVTSIGYCAFAGCKSLIEFALPEGVKQIGGSAFSGCSSLKRLSLPESLENIGELAFQRCSKLTLLVSEGTYAQKYAADNGIRYKFR
jgi:hypothetical protein